MERRNAIIAMLASTIGLMSGKAVMAKDDLAIAMGPTISDWNQAPSTVTFNLAAYKSFDFTLGAEKVSLTPAEIMAALRHH